MAFKLTLAPEARLRPYVAITRPAQIDPRKRATRPLVSVSSNGGAGKLALRVASAIAVVGWIVSLAIMWGWR